MASLVNMGLAPGAAIVTLVFGCSTNLSSIVPTLKFLGKRLTISLVISAAIISIMGGYLTNVWMAETIELKAAMRPSTMMAASENTDLLLAC